MENYNLHLKRKSERSMSLSLILVHPAFPTCYHIYIYIYIYINKFSLHKDLWLDDDYVKYCPHYLLIKIFTPVWYKK